MVINGPFKQKDIYENISLISSSSSWKVDDRPMPSDLQRWAMLLGAVLIRNYSHTEVHTPPLQIS